MVSIFLFILAIIFTLYHLYVKKQAGWKTVLLSYILLLNVGIMGLIAFAAHVFWAPETAESIGWAPGSPFQYEIGMANLSYGILGIAAFWIREKFWLATIIGWSALLLGCFIGHLIQYFLYNDTAPNNIGVYVWFNDLILPILALTLLWVKSEK